MIAVSAVRQTFAAVRALLVLTVLLGVLYPAAVTAAAFAVPGRAAGSLVSSDGRTVGSALLGQKFTGAAWFQSRPSTSDYSGLTSGGSNYGQSDARQAASVAARRRDLLAANPHAVGPVPADALTASASGLDPDISPAYARWQVARVAAARHLPPARVRALVEAHVTAPTLGLLGSSRVNVLQLNLALRDLRTGGQ